jgi:YVTN family beta-propeller protein
MRLVIILSILSIFHCFLVSNAESETEISIHSYCYDIVLSDNHSIGYITGTGNGCIVLVDFSQQQPHSLKQINIPESEPFCLKINPIRNELYVTGKNTNNLYIIDLSQIHQYMANPYDVQLAITSIPIGKAPRKIAISSDGKTIFVATTFNGSEGISVIDAERKRLIDSIPFEKGTDPFGMAIDQNKLYVVDTKIGSNIVYVIDIDTYSIISTIPVEDSPYDAIASNDSYIYVSHDSIEGKISIINVSTDTVEKSISLGGNSDSTYKVTKGMIIKNDILYAVNSGDKSIAMINVLTNQLIKCASPIKAGLSKPENLSASIDGNQLYIVHPYEKRLTIVDLPFTCPSFKQDLDMDIPNDTGPDSLYVLDSEVCENQPLTLTLSVDKPHLFKTKPYFSKTGYITFETNETKTGIAKIDMTLRDSYGKCSDSRSFTMNLLAEGSVLNIEKDGFGQVIIDDGYFETCLPCTDCTEDCMVLPPINAIFPKGSKVTLTAQPNENWCFKNWSGAINETTNPIELELYRELTTIKAVFAEQCIPKGYAIIIQGRNLNKEGEETHRNTTDYVYKTLKKRGFNENNIKYLRYDNEKNPIKNPNSEPDPDKIKHAITEWALDNMNKNIADLYIVLVGHGDENTIFFDDKILSSSDLNQYLNVFNTFTDANIVVVIGACKSGSFVKELSAQNRIIITSSKADENSNKGKSFDDQIIQEGDYFIYHFFNNVNDGYSIRDSFKEASFATSKYFDNQHPLLDDNHDGIGTFDLLSMLNSEGEKSKGIFVGEDLSNQDDNHVTTRFLVLPYMVLDSDCSSASFSLDLGDTNRFDQFWIDVKSKITRTNSDTRTIKPKILIKPGIVDSAKAQWNDIDKFDQPGTYQVLYFAKETATDHVLLLREKIVYKNKHKELNLPPGNFAILTSNEPINPVYSNPEYTFPLDWSDTSDPDDDHFTYTVLISKNENFNDTIRIQGVSSSLSMINFKTLNELEQIYYYKVQAIDQYGAIKETETTQLHITSSNTVQQGWIKGHVIDNRTQIPIIKANIFQVSGESSSILNVCMDGYGKFIGYAPLGSYVIKAEAEGYIDIEKNITINSLWPDKDIIVYLEPSVSVEMNILKYLADMVKTDESLPITKAIDISNDGKIGLEEAIYYQPCTNQ